MGLIIFFLLTTPLLVLFVFLIVLYLSSISISWWVVFIPIWILFFCWIIYMFYISWKEKMKKTKPNQPSTWNTSLAFNLFAFFVLLAFSLLLAATLQNSASNGGTINTALLFSTFAVLWLFLLGCALYALSCRCGLSMMMTRTIVITPATRNSNKCCICYHPCQGIDYILGSLMWSAVVVFSILLVIKINSMNLFPWYIVFIPAWIFILVWIIEIGVCFYKKINRSQEEGFRKISIIEILFQAFLIAGTLTFLILLNIELSDPNSIGITALFLPVIILLVILFIIAYSLDLNSTQSSRWYSFYGYKTQVYTEDNDNNWIYLRDPMAIGDA